ncbi:DUF4259 domain-containing protein [Streptomyces broussonetiae]|uniref:DUF4259 domain-containing protein n=1 Tax=Streptomyces broussonetiae TaxID=2686304 RepID=A0A6I6N0G0_9ACTN|nr:DUF4259 domain-containing protein [Streptomyces broussonetiae]QHA02275.1 DUF4259 domain-containing protein [Streptomyces broussonetiae]
MGTWGTGPFDNDTASDFAIALDNAEPEQREFLIRGALARTAKATGYLTEAEEAVAAAALIATQCPGGEPIDTAYVPEKPMPVFPVDLRTLAAEALTRILDDESELAANWVEPADARRWLTTISHLCGVLAPPSASTDVPLFDLDS